MNVGNRSRPELELQRSLNCKQMGGRVHLPDGGDPCSTLLLDGRRAPAYIGT